MRCITRNLLCLAIGSLLAGCGGASDSDSSSSAGVATTMSGKVIDGYITGATVYLDLNFNNKRDENEPFTVTKSEGDFDLAVPASYQKCSQYVPVVVDVPVGAVDSDAPNIPIDEAYSMVFPPSFALSADKDLLNLTPLTTVLWSEVEKELSKSQSSALSCESILADQQLRYDIGQKLTEQSKRVANHYNVTVDELYSDYVASDDAALHVFAKKIVPGLQKSYAETVELNEVNPNAELAWVEYYLGEWDVTLEAYNKKWYRHQVILTADGSLNSKTHLVSDDLQTKGALIAQGEMLTTVRYGVDITKRTNLSLSSDNVKFKCYFDEILATQSSEVMNSIDVEVDNWDECKNKIIAGTVTQTLKTKDYQDNVLIRVSEYRYLPGNNSSFSDLIGVADTVTNEQIKERINAVRDVILDTDFDGSEFYGADGWTHIKYAIGNAQDKNARVVTYRHNLDNKWKWQRVTYYENGKITNECGASEADMSLGGCSS
ncbi:hypothetical protein [Moritella sp. Urea-trap-13]|uniref:hypothetical protein n=1 Tax=Moritella sp. Urea-trap-13 TaxID=2058327 RepID=UPI000C32A22B|nr:hypothetical protein [Moritella sp. Urea-trap-13]PKH06956.1 hypothetical protein CXF93_13835 [Moritella sp. Urea-trap-13]